ncbi:copper homeostasis periplasmic binding protein CopC [Ramlibacter sp.]|uniref:copper homeostasis periplasmic binding protein CopC n=1 Tax=Ramlibacter sp. TaxID=1917967 RepID=UPI00263918FD|nr:copper homeostasis periplasmic binding protein CopC [Ramlibacter sp.]MDB5955473.1 hypothetical protein [Ramlibacter sp.]
MMYIVRLSLFVLAFGAASSVFAHARLQTSDPQNGANVAAPSSITLHYNEPVEAAMSNVKLFGPDNAAVETGSPATRESDDTTLVTTLPKLSAGAYRLEWSTMGHDGHHTKGELRFTVK